MPRRAPAHPRWRHVDRRGRAPRHARAPDARAAGRPAPSRSRPPETRPAAAPRDRAPCRSLPSPRSETTPPRRARPDPGPPARRVRSAVRTRGAMSTRDGRGISTSIPIVVRGVGSARAAMATAISRLWLIDPTKPGGSAGAPRGVDRIGDPAPSPGVGAERRDRGAQRDAATDEARAPRGGRRVHESRLVRVQRRRRREARVIGQRHGDAHARGKLALEAHHERHGPPPTRAPRRGPSRPHRG